MARMKPISTEIYSSRKQAERDASMLNRDPLDPPRKAKVVKRAAYGLAWGEKKGRGKRAKR